MPKKEHIPILRSSEFNSIDDLLNEALESLDAANARIQALLASEAPPAAATADASPPQAPATEPEAS
jgi:hypothetical protein